MCARVCVNEIKWAWMCGTPRTQAAGAIYNHLATSLLLPCSIAFPASPSLLWPFTLCNCRWKCTVHLVFYTWTVELCPKCLKLPFLTCRRNIPVELWYSWYPNWYHDGGRLFIWNDNIIFSQVKDTENVRVVAEYLINIATTSKVSIFTLAVANILSLRA